MNFLTPQERSVVFTCCLILFVGIMIKIGMQKEIKVLDWLKTVENRSVIVKLDVNTASAQELLSIPGVGPKTAQYILAYRRFHGCISSLDFITRAKAMTPRRFETINRYLKVKQCQ